MPYRKFRVTALLISLAWSGTACSQAPSPAATADQPATPATTDTPAVVATIERQGWEVMGEFEAPGGLRGFAGIAGQRPLAVYVTPDGEHAIVGTMVDELGRDVGEAALKRLVAQPTSKRVWARLEESRWVRDGRADAPRIVYTFSDPNCPYCHRFWESARPWVDSGKVQLRHVLVGVIREDSANKVAAILEADSPSDALALNERNYADGGISPLPTVSTAVRSLLAANEMLMLELGFQGTPGILFLDDEGLLQRRSGMPTPQDLPVVLGPQ